MGYGLHVRTVSVSVYSIFNWSSINSQQTAAGLLPYYSSHIYLCSMTCEDINLSITLLTCQSRSLHRNHFVSFVKFNGRKIFTATPYLRRLEKARPPIASFVRYPASGVSHRVLSSVFGKLFVRQQTCNGAARERWENHGAIPVSWSNTRKKRARNSNRLLPGVDLDSRWQNGNNQGESRIFKRTSCSSYCCHQAFEWLGRLRDVILQ